MQSACKIINRDTIFFGAQPINFHRQSPKNVQVTPDAYFFRRTIGELTSRFMTMCEKMDGCCTYFPRSPFVIRIMPMINLSAMKKTMIPSVWLRLSFLGCGIPESVQIGIATNFAVALPTDQNVMSDMLRLPCQ